MPPLKTVLDTNIVVSAHLQGTGFRAFVLDLAQPRKSSFMLRQILEEYEAVLRRPRFGIDSKKIAQSIRLIKRKAKRVKPTRRLSVSDDPDDNRFIECAETAEADYADYVVTGNRGIIHRSIRRPKLSARELIEIITPELKR